MSMIAQELGLTWPLTGLVVASALGSYAAIIVYIRLAGIRSHSRMSTFDFATIIAIGAVIGRVVLVLYAVQFAVAMGRRRHRFSRVVDNQPLMLMVGRRMLSENLRDARVTEDVRAKLREANVYNYDTLRAVVLETTRHQRPPW